jgi:hypothetical protein
MFDKEKMIAAKMAVFLLKSSLDNIIIGNTVKLPISNDKNRTENSEIPNKSIQIFSNI